MQLVFAQIEAFAAQPTDIVRQLFEAVASHHDLLDVGKMGDVGPVESQLVVIQREFFQAVEFHDPSRDMTDLVAFQIKCFQVFALANARWDAGQLAIRQVQTLDVIVFRKIDIAKATSVQRDVSQAIGRKQRLVHYLCPDARKADQPHLVILGKVGEGIHKSRIKREHRDGIGVAVFQFSQVSFRCGTTSCGLFTQLLFAISIGIGRPDGRLYSTREK